jgi:hypothetical protein
MSLPLLRAHSRRGARIGRARASMRLAITPFLPGHRVGSDVGRHMLDLAHDDE